MRVQQFTALLLMQQLQVSKIDDDTQPAICWMNLKDGEFVDLNLQQNKRLHSAIGILRLMLQERNATDAQMRAALTDAEYSDYKQSFNYSVVHIEEMWMQRPPQINYYLSLLKLGDLFDGNANRIANRAAISKHGVKYDERGQSAAQKMRYKAEHCYEQALEYLACECDDMGNGGMLQQWFDRPLNFDMDTSIFNSDVVSVPRLRGSRSQYCLDKTKTVWGASKSKFYRQREAITNSVFELLFAEREPELQEWFVSDLVKDLIAKREERLKNEPQTTNSKAGDKLQRLLRNGLDDDEDL
jgi:hypothetical protein